MGCQLRISGERAAVRGYLTLEVENHIIGNSREEHRQFIIIRFSVEAGDNRFIST